MQHGKMVELVYLLSRGWERWSLDSLGPTYGCQFRRSCWDFLLVLLDHTLRYNFCHNLMSWSTVNSELLLSHKSITFSLAFTIDYIKVIAQKSIVLVQKSVILVSQTYHNFCYKFPTWLIVISCMSFLHGLTTLFSSLMVDQVEELWLSLWY